MQRLRIVNGHCKVCDNSSRTGGWDEQWKQEIEMRLQHGSGKVVKGGSCG